MFIWTWWVSFNLNSDSARCSGCLVKLRTSVEEMSYANHHYYVGYCQMITHVSICVPTFYLSIYLWIDLSISVCIMYIYILYIFIYIYSVCVINHEFSNSVRHKKKKTVIRPGPPGRPEVMLEKSGAPGCGLPEQLWRSEVPRCGSMWAQEMGKSHQKWRLSKHGKIITDFPCPINSRRNGTN
jgi:hypothetical protein